MLSNEHEKSAIFMDTAIKKIAGINQPLQAKILDFGTGSGRLVNSLKSLGYQAYGCDKESYWERSNVDVDRFSVISLDPYRLPYEDNTFDVVLSTSVLEHAQNKEELFLEICRVLKQGGYSMHLFPSKWYLPVEPHIYVPLVNFLWPKCPKWWLAIWALLGVRNEFQNNKSWKEVLDHNFQFCSHGLSYWPNSEYKKLSMKVFGNFSAPMDFYINNSYGGVGSLLRKIPLLRLTSWVAGKIRMVFIVQRKPV